LIQPTKYKPREKPRHRHGNERKLKDKNTEKIREGQAERNKQTTERGGRKRTRKKKNREGDRERTATEKKKRQKERRVVAGAPPAQPPASIAIRLASSSSTPR
jgi:hypothetical protein